MKSLITGGAGFIGSHLADALVNLGHQVIILDNLSTGHLTNLEQSKNKIQFVNIDVSDNQKTIDQYFKGVDWVFHMAGLADVISSIKEPDKYFKANVIGTLNMIKACQQTTVKDFIFSSSCAVYKESTSKVKETTKIGICSNVCYSSNLWKRRLLCRQTFLTLCSRFT